MTKEEAIAYFEGQKERLEAFRKMYPSPYTVGYQATTKEIGFYDMAISALKGGWIPIEEREPNNYDEALVCTDTEEIFKATYYAWEDFDDDNGNAYSGEIIAWQPLPEPYKAESEDKE